MSWQTVKLGELTTITSGYAFDSKKFNKENGMQLIRIRDITRSYSETFYTGEYDSKYIINYGDILIGMDGEFNAAKWLGGNALLNQRVCKIEPYNQLIHSNYLLHILPKELKKIEDATPFVTVKHLSIKSINEISIPLPPISEQKRIAAILDKADEIRRKREQAIAKLEQLAQSIFVEMFGDPVTNQKGWKLKKWDDVLKIINGKNQKNVLTINGAYPIFGSGGNEMGRANDFLCNENTIIIGRKGNINKPILIKEKFWNVDTAFGLHAKKEILSFQYLYWFCVFFNFEKLNKTVTIPSLTKSDLLQIQMPLPPIALQEEFAKRINQIEKLKADNTMALANHNALFASLQQQAFSGNL